MFREIIQGSQRLPLGLHGRSQKSVIFWSKWISWTPNSRKVRSQFFQERLKAGRWGCLYSLAWYNFIFHKKSGGITISQNSSKQLLFFLTWITTHTNISKPFGYAGLQFCLVYLFGAGMEPSHSASWKTLPLKTYLVWCLQAIFETCLCCFAFFLLTLVVRLIMLSHICS